MSEWLSRHRAIVWIAAVFLGPTIAGLLTLARPELLSKRHSVPFDRLRAHTPYGWKR